MIKNKSKLAIKLLIIIWIVVAVSIALILAFTFFEQKILYWIIFIIINILIIVICILRIVVMLMQQHAKQEPNNVNILKDKDKLLLACKNADLTNVATNRMVLKYIDGLKIREIADLEKVEELTISQSIRRSRRKLNL